MRHAHTKIPWSWYCFVLTRKTESVPRDTCLWEAEVNLGGLTSGGCAVGV